MSNEAEWTCRKCGMKVKSADVIAKGYGHTVTVYEEGEYREAVCGPLDGPTDGAAGSAISIMDLAQRGELLIQIGGEIRESSSRFAADIGRLRASMDEVSSLLRTSAESIQRMADGMRYDELRGVRHALDVHALLLRDLADELDRPGQTKYSPNTK